MLLALLDANLDVVRNPELGPTPYIARGIFHAVFALSSDRQDAERNPLSLFTSLPVRRSHASDGMKAATNLSSILK